MLPSSLWIFLCGGGRRTVLADESRLIGSRDLFSILIGYWHIPLRFNLRLWISTNHSSIECRGTTRYNSIANQIRPIGPGIGSFANIWEELVFVRRPQDLVSTTELECLNNPLPYLWPFIAREECCACVWKAIRLLKSDGVTARGVAAIVEKVEKFSAILIKQFWVALFGVWCIYAICVMCICDIYHDDDAAAAVVAAIVEKVENF